MSSPANGRWLVEVIAAAIPDAVAVVDLEDLVIAWNRAMASLVETAPGVALGRQFAALDVSYRIPQLRAALEEAKRTLQPRVLSALPFPRRAGPPTTATVTLTPIRDDRRVAILIHVAEESPERRLSIDVEQLEAENQRLLVGTEELLALNEELRSARDDLELELGRVGATRAEAALTGRVASAVLGLARARSIDAEAVERAFALLEDTPRLEPRVLEELADLKTLTRGELRLQRTNVALDAVAVEAADRVTDNSTGVRLDVIAAERVIVSADSRRLQQVASMLVRNAVRFTPTGGRVDIAVDREGSRARLRVSDTGCGLSPALLPHVFEPFHHGNGRGPAAHRGLGLRLALARRVIELHGGAIRADSPGDGLGTTMIVSLPTVRDA